MSEPPGPASLDTATLLYLDALLRARHVSRAAESVGLSQPAMSRALARARAALGDELLVRGAHGALHLTPRARALSGHVRDAIAALELALSDATTWAPLVVEASACARALVTPALAGAWAAEARPGLFVVRASAPDPPRGALRIGGRRAPGAVALASWPRALLAPSALAGALDLDAWASLGHVRLGERDEADLDAWALRRSIAQIEDPVAALGAAGALGAAVALPAPLARGAREAGLAELGRGWGAPAYTAWARGEPATIAWARAALAAEPGALGFSPEPRLDSRPENGER